MRSTLVRGVTLVALSSLLALGLACGGGDDDDSANGATGGQPGAGGEPEGAGQPGAGGEAGGGTQTQSIDVDITATDGGTAPKT